MHLLVHPNDAHTKTIRESAFNLVKLFLFIFYIHILPVAVETPRILQAHSTTIHQTLSEFPMTSNTFPRHCLKMQPSHCLLSLFEIVGGLVVTKVAF